MEMEPVTRVNRKPIKICVNEENGFKYQDNTCNTWQTQGWETSQISNCAMSEQILLPSPQSWPALTWGKNKSNIQFAGDMGSQIFYTLPDMAPSVFTSIISPVCCPGQDAESCGQMMASLGISWSWFNSSSPPQPSGSDYNVQRRCYLHNCHCV